MSRACHNLLIHCMDFRLQKDIFAWMQEKGLLGDTDTISIAGAGKEILSPELPQYRDFLLKQVGLSKDLHSIKRVILMHHTDCGAYKNEGPFQDELAEEVKHITDMQNTASLIEERWPELEVKTILIKMTGAENKFLEIK